MRRAASTDGAVTRAVARQRKRGAVPAKALLAVHERTGQMARQFVQLRFSEIGEGGTQDGRHIDPDFLQSGNDGGGNSPSREAGLPTGLDRDKRIDDLHAPSMP